MGRTAAAVLAILSLAGAVPHTSLAQEPQSQPTQSPPPQTASPSRDPSSPTDSSPTDTFSIDRLRRKLDRAPAFTFAAPDAQLPVFRLRIEGYDFHLPTWRESFVIPPSPVPQTFGGVNYDDMQRLTIRPDVQAIWNRDALGIVQTRAESALLLWLFKKAVESNKQQTLARVHAEVQQELAEIEAHNARVAAAEAGGGVGDDETKVKGGRKKAEGGRKKVEGERKKEEEKKKKKDGASGQQ